MLTHLVHQGAQVSAQQFPIVQSKPIALVGVQNTFNISTLYFAKQINSLNEEKQAYSDFYSFSLI